MFYRDDGTVIRLVTLFFLNPIGTNSPDQFAFVTRRGEREPRMVYPHYSPDKSLGWLSVEECKESGRKGLLSILSPGEIMGAIVELQQSYGLHSPPEPTQYSQLSMAI